MPRELVPDGGPVYVVSNAKDASLKVFVDQDGNEIDTSAMKSPDGSTWKQSIDDAGDVTWVKVP